MTTRSCENFGNSDACTQGGCFWIHNDGCAASLADEEDARAKAVAETKQMLAAALAVSIVAVAAAYFLRKRYNATAAKYRQLKSPDMKLWEYHLSEGNGFTRLISMALTITAFGLAIAALVKNFRNGDKRSEQSDTREGPAGETMFLLVVVAAFPFLGFLCSMYFDWHGVMGVLMAIAAVLTVVLLAIHKPVAVSASKPDTQGSNNQNPQ